MDGWDFLMGIVNIVPRLPLEKFLQRDPSKDFDQFAQSLEKKGLLTEPPSMSRNPLPTSNVISADHSPMPRKLSPGLELVNKYLNRYLTS
jgi:hypothetical protein